LDRAGILAQGDSRVKKLARWSDSEFMSACCRERSKEARRKPARVKERNKVGERLGVKLDRIQTAGSRQRDKLLPKLPEPAQQKSGRLELKQWPCRHKESMEEHTNAKVAGFA